MVRYAGFQGAPFGILQVRQCVERFAIEHHLGNPGEPGGGPVSPFPAALIDAMAGYRYLNLVNRGFPEEDIIIVGDSAGGSDFALAPTS